jgi:hypothetical protein
MNLKEKMASDMKHAFSQLNAVFTYNGTDYKCSVSYGAMELDALDMGGIMENSSISITTLVEYFTNSEAPNTSSIIIVEGVEFVVDSEPIVQAGTPLLVFKASKPDLHREL